MGFLTRFMVFCIVTIIFIVVVSATALLGVELARDYAAYAAVKNTSCESFMADLKGPEPARSAAAVELFNTPSGNIFFKVYQPGLKDVPPRFTEVLATCTKLPQITLMQAMANAASGGVDKRIKSLLASEGIIQAPAMTPENLQTELNEYRKALDATAVSGTAVSASVPSPTQPQAPAAVHPAKKK
jgi:hypothetical protein